LVRLSTGPFLLVFLNQTPKPSSSSSSSWHHRLLNHRPLCHPHHRGRHCCRSHQWLSSSNIVISVGGYNNSKNNNTCHATHSSTAPSPPHVNWAMKLRCKNSEIKTKNRKKDNIEGARRVE